MNPVKRLADGIRVVGWTLCQDMCWLYRGAVHFPLGDGWTVAISLESADRLRVDACRGGQARATLWVLPGDHGRLVELVRELSDRVELPV